LTPAVCIKLLTRWTATVLEKEIRPLRNSPRRLPAKRPTPHSVQVARRGVESRIEQNGRDKEGQSQIRFDLDGRRERQEGKTGARERKERRVGNFKPTREPGNKHGAARHRKV
jgi:hypothetical protein